MSNFEDTTYPLFKYLSKETYLFDILKNQRLYFNSFRSYNDPYEIFTYLQNIKNDQPYVNRIIKDEIKACCFSRDKSEYLLWSHYSNSHKGFCLEFDFTKYREKTKSGNLYMIDFGDIQIYEIPITYSHYSLKKEFTNDVPTITFEDIIEIASHKYGFWKYEKENRFIIFQKEPGYIEIPRDTIKALYYGVLVFDKRIEYINTRLKNMSYNIPTKKYSLMANIGKVM